MKIVSGEVTDVDASKRMNLASNPVLGESPKFMDLQLSTAHTADKLNYVIGSATKVGGLTNNTDGIMSRHCIAKVTADRVSEVKAYSEYIKHSEFETMKVFESRK